VFDTDKVSAEIICDGFHIHPAVLRSTFKLIADRLVIISDSMRANGLPEGEISELGGQEVIVKDGKATLSDGTLAGSVTNIFSEIKNLVEYGVPFEAAVKAATINPAKVIGVDDKVGSIENGKLADLLILDENMDIVAVYH
jgi:N-acetylglucosamine-6-phosphate deacetylase